MYVKNCCYRGCKNDSRYSHKPYMEGIFFIPFPKPKSNLHKCKRWLSACARPEFLNHQKITKYRFVCSFHFLGGAGPTENNPDPIAYHEFCNDDTHETCKIYPEESKTNLDVSSIIVDEPSSIVEKPILGAEELDLLVGESRLIAEDPGLIAEFPGLIAEFPGLIAEDPGLIAEDPGLIAEDPGYVIDTTDLLKKFLENQLKMELKWTICREDDSGLKLFKINGPHIFAIEVRVNVNLEFEILVYGKAIAKNHSSLRSCPKNVSKLSDLLNLLEIINSLTLCNGTGLNCEETKYYGKMAKINIYTKTFFSQNCYGFVANGNRKRCKNCKLFRNSQLLQQKRRAKAKDLKKNPRNFQTMTREDLVAAITIKTRQNRILKRKNIQLKKNINTLKLSLSENPNFVFSQAIEEDSVSSKEKFLHLLYQEQLKLLKTKSKRPKKWHSDIIKWCLYLRAKSPSAYETLREVLPLPAPRTLRHSRSEFSCQNGFTVESFKKMRAKIDLGSSDEHQPSTKSVDIRTAMIDPEYIIKKEVNDQENIIKTDDIDPEYIIKKEVEEDNAQEHEELRHIRPDYTSEEEGNSSKGLHFKKESLGDYNEF